MAATLKSEKQQNETTEKSKGCCIVFNSNKDREGCEKDIKNIKEMCEQCNIDCFNVDLDNTSIIDGYEIYMKVIKQAAFVMVFYMAHGREDDRDGDYVYVKKPLIESLLKQKSLDKKLKWIIFQRCRGFAVDSKTYQDSPETSFFPKYYMLSHASSRGEVAERTVDGCPYITAICEQLRHFRHERTLKQMLGDMRIVKKIKSPYEDNFPNRKDFSFVTCKFERRSYN